MPVRLLLVDDHALLRDGLRLRLEQEPGWTVVAEAGDAEEAVRQAAEHQPDLVVMDLNLPGANGIEATKRLRAVHKALKILVVTGETAEEFAHDAILAGANGFLRKADASAELIKAIQTLLVGKTYLSTEAAGALAAAVVTREVTKESDLSEQETAVLKALAEGLSHKEIAQRLEVSPKSVETYKARLSRKTGLSTRAELVRFAIRKGLIKA